MRPYEYFIYYRCSDFTDYYDDEANEDSDSKLDELLVVYTYDASPPKHIVHEIEGVLKYNRLNSRSFKVFTNQTCANEIETPNTLEPKIPSTSPEATDSVKSSTSLSNISATSSTVTSSSTSTTVKPSTKSTIIDELINPSESKSLSNSSVNITIQ